MKHELITENFENLKSVFDPCSFRGSFPGQDRRIRTVFIKRSCSADINRVSPSSITSPSPLRRDWFTGSYFRLHNFLTFRR